MESRHQIKTVILLLAAVLALTTLAQKLLIPYPILLVIGGLILGLIPVFRPSILIRILSFLSSCRPPLSGRLFHVTPAKVW
jgi:NhaP-type Na+/H+ or K+/H+ antiporter